MVKTPTPSRAAQHQAPAARRWQFNIMMLPYFIAAAAIILLGAKLYIIQWEARQVLPGNTYQAVFLSNGQIYFGHLETLGRNYLQLSDVYYLQEQAAVTTDEPSTDQATQSNISVVRLGNEIHEPQNGLVLNKDHVLFWENLNTDSRIIEAIQKEKAGE